MTIKILQLKKPIELHGKKLAELAFKEPSGAQYLDFGEPRVLIKTKEDSLFWAENDLVIARYLDACVQSEEGPVAIKLLSLADARKAKELILGFFTDTDQATSEK